MNNYHIGDIFDFSYHHVISSLKGDKHTPNKSKFVSKLQVFEVPILFQMIDNNPTLLLLKRV